MACKCHNAPSAIAGHKQKSDHTIKPLCMLQRRTYFNTWQPSLVLGYQHGKSGLSLEWTGPVERSAGKMRVAGVLAGGRD